MSSASEPRQAPPLLAAGEVLIANPNLPDAPPSVVKEVSLTTWTKRGWVRVEEPKSSAEAKPAVKPNPAKRTEDAAVPSSHTKEK